MFLKDVVGRTRIRPDSKLPNDKTTSVNENTIVRDATREGATKEEGTKIVGDRFFGAEGPEIRQVTYFWARKIEKT